MDEQKLGMFRNRLTKMFRHLNRQAKRQGISCYRVYDHDLPEFPLRIEIYDDKIYLAEYRRSHGMAEEAHALWLEACLQVIVEIMGVPAEKIYLHERQRKAGRQGQYGKMGSEETFCVVEEAGLRFSINLSDYLDTGLFTDHRITRGMVRAEAGGKEVLNLFSYTGSFSVYAAAGGAAAVTSVDLSNTYLQWAEKNMALNGLLDKTKHRFVRADATQWLDEAPADAFDLVIMDPPTFSNSKRMKDFLDIQRDHAALINKVLRVLKAGGALYFSTNFRRFQLEADKIASSSIKDITRATTPFDFQGKLSRWCYRIVK
jgi:23S rRNA (cytosine1962-C5)-methyltransferase